MRRAALRRSLVCDARPRGVRAATSATARLSRGGSGLVSVALLGLVLLALAVGCGPPEGAPEVVPRSFDELVRQLYERARDSGEKVPEDAIEWAREDVDRIGDWEYRVLRLADGEDAALEAQLDELGTERWEVFWLERERAGEGDGLRVFLKRPSRSVLHMLPLSELGRLVPGS